MIGNDCINTAGNKVWQEPVAQNVYPFLFSNVWDIWEIKKLKKMIVNLIKYLWYFLVMKVSIIYLFYIYDKNYISFYKYYYKSKKDNG